MVQREERAERSRAAILDAAVRLFADQGYDATSLADIGAAAGLSRGAPSYFFGSKEGLYRATLARVFTETRELVAAAAAGPNQATSIRDAVRAYVDWLSRHPEYVALIQRENLAGGRFLMGLPEHLEAIAEVMSRVGTQPSPGRLHTLINVIGLCWFPFANAPLVRELGLDPFTAEFAAGHAEDVTAMLLKTRAAAPSNA